MLLINSIRKDLFVKIFFKNKYVLYYFQGENHIQVFQNVSY